MAVSSVAFTVFPLSLVVGLSRLAVAADKARVARYAHRDTCVAEEHYPFGGGRPIFRVGPISLFSGSIPSLH